MMTRAQLIQRAYVMFQDSGGDEWKTDLRFWLKEQDMNRDELEEMADFCEQAAVVITEVRESL